MFDALFSIIEGHKRDKPAGSYTPHLLNGGEDLILRKIGEETIEVLLASKGEGEQRLVEETADLIYHVFVLMSHKEISLDKVKGELKKRHQRKQ